MATGVPELALQPNEAELLARAIADLSVYYDLDVMGGKWGAIAALVATAGLVYGPRVKSVMSKRAAAKAAKKAAQPANPLDVGPEPAGGVFDLSGALNMG